MSSGRDDELPADRADCASGDILIVDDERVIRDGLALLLSGEGFCVRTARDGEEALAAFAERRPGLVLLDVMMPKMNGFAVCEKIRESDRAVPVVFLTAKDSDADQVRGFGLGADDYLSKDAPESLLVVRVRRAIDRVRELSASIRSASRTVHVGAVDADLTTLEVRSGEETLSRLTRTEAGILERLDADRGRGVSADDIIASLRGEGFVCEDTMLYVHVSNLRRKLGSAGAAIVSVRGVGYLLK